MRMSFARVTRIASLPRSFRRAVREISTLSWSRSTSGRLPFLSDNKYWDQYRSGTQQSARSGCRMTATTAASSMVRGCSPPSPLNLSHVDALDRPHSYASCAPFFHPCLPPVKHPLHTPSVRFAVLEMSTSHLWMKRLWAAVSGLGPGFGRIDGIPTGPQLDRGFGRNDGIPTGPQPDHRSCHRLCP